MDHFTLFYKRLTQLRNKQGISARDMSLSLGQSESYINKIENGKALPSMSAFFYICEYLHITPVEFFDTENKNPTKNSELMGLIKNLNSEDLDMLITLIKRLKK